MPDSERVRRGYRFKNKWRTTQRQEVLERYGRRCVLCGHPGDDGNGKGLIQAHLVADRQGGAGDADDVILVCRRCSGTLDGGRRYR